MIRIPFKLLNSLELFFPNEIIRTFFESKPNYSINGKAKKIVDSFRFKNPIDFHLFQFNCDLLYKTSLSFGIRHRFIDGYDRFSIWSIRSSSISLFVRLGTGEQACKNAQTHNTLYSKNINFHPNAAFSVDHESVIEIKRILCCFNLFQ